MNESIARKKVLWINHFMPFPAKGGLLIRTCGLLEKVAEIHDVTLIYLIQPRLVTPFFNDYEEGMRLAEEKFSQLNLKTHSFEINSEKNAGARVRLLIKSLFTKSPYSVNWLKNEALKNYMSKIDTANFDYIHVDTMGLMDNIPLSAYKTYIAVNHHNAEHSMMLRRANKEISFMKRQYMQIEARKIAKFDKYKLSKVNINLTCSEDDAEELKKLNSLAQTKVVPNGVTVKEQVSRNPIRTKFLFIGGLDWYPNTDAIHFLLDEIVPKLIENKLDITIDVVGKNPPGEIFEKVKKQSIVKIHGFVEDIEKFYEEANAFICPLRDGGGTKLKVLDAMMHGLPVIGSDIAFEGICIENNVSGLICDCSSDYVREIKNLISNSEIVSSIGEASRQLVIEKYSAESISMDYAEFIGTVGSQYEK